jgi:hypothetical protein
MDSSSNSLNGSGVAKMKSNEAASSSSSAIIIKTASYYTTVFRDLTLNIFKHYALDLLFTAFKIGYDNLNVAEKFVVIVYGEFAEHKSFLNNLDVARVNSKYGLTLQDVGTFRQWLRDELKGKLAVKYEDVDEATEAEKSECLELANLMEGQACDLCGARVRVELGLELASVRCERGHTVNRCQKTLLPLNNFRHARCGMCGSCWNFLSVKDYGHFKHLNQDLDFCLFCDY